MRRWLAVLGLSWVLGCGAGGERGDAGVVDAGGPDAGPTVRPFPGVTCLGTSFCQTPAADVCASLVDLAVGDLFAVAFENESAFWTVTMKNLEAPFVRGVLATSTFTTSSNGQSSTATLVYDGDCGVWGRSSDCCGSTNPGPVGLTITAVRYR
jgi:hypothetical protein